MRERFPELIAAAREALQRAYAPYSKFHVGAAILTDKGEIVTGCNVENASYGLTICAERTAMTRAVIQDAGRPVAVAVATRTPTPTPPCGACRQFLYEFNPDIIVLCCAESGDPAETTLRDLLPGAFDTGQLNSAAP
ncbi:MAG: cytidine deaminase [Candidatus Sumerlaeota bacterium]|nr:cytidine deaminase [Candidatus Sumerlaeota bacterium]